MKKLFSLLALLVTVTFAADAQSVQVATLTHDGTITSYTGANALRDAYTAAIDGDVITLSSGSFSSVNFEKRITVRGAGMGVKVNDSDPYIEPTILKGNFSINAGGNGDHNFKLEGILCEETILCEDISDDQFSKCRIAELRHLYYNSPSQRTSFINCIIYKKCKLSNYSTTSFYGCYLKDIALDSHNNLTNCILEIAENSFFIESNCVVKNSIYLNTNGYKDCQSNGTIFNSIWSGAIYNNANNSFWNTLESHNNTIVPEGTQLFKEGTFYQLTDEAKKYLGDDGTEVGLYGGSLPFDPTPTNPQITKFNVAPKTTADGKLSVDIEVNAK